MIAVTGNFWFFCVQSVVFFAVRTKLATLPQLLHCFSSVPELGAAAMINEVVGV